MPNLVTVKKLPQLMAELYHRTGAVPAWRPDEDRLNRLLPELMPTIQHPVILEAVRPPDPRHGYAARYRIADDEGSHIIQYITDSRFLEGNMEGMEPWTGIPGSAGLSAVLWHELTHAEQAERHGMNIKEDNAETIRQHTEVFGTLKAGDLLRRLSPTSWMDLYATVPDEAEAFARARDLQEYSIATLIGGLNDEEN